MAISCVPNDLVALATTAGFCCITSDPYEFVKLYLLREAANSTATPQELINLAKCHICNLGSIFKGVEWYLICDIAGGV